MIEKRSCQDEIPVLGTTVGDFWAWAYSDILNNTDRAVFAKFVVGMALGVIDTPRVEWDAVDLQYSDKTIEVKSAAYVQSWHKEQDPPSESLSTSRSDSLGMRRPTPTKSSQAGQQTATCSASTSRRIGAEPTSSTSIDGSFTWFLPSR